MKKFINHSLLILFFIASLFMGGLIIGPVSVRIYTSSILLFWLLVNLYRYRIMTEIWLYIFFILFYWIALVMNQEIVETDIVKHVIARYIICFIAVYAIRSIVNAPHILKNYIYLFIGIGIINGLVSLLQFSGSNSAMFFPLLLNPTQTSQEKLEFFLQFDSGLGVGVVGLFSNVVKNGYLSAVFAVLSPILFENAKKSWHKGFAVIIMVFLFYAVFMTQQRLVTILVAIFYLYRFYKNRSLFIIMSTSIFMLIFYTIFRNIDFDTANLGRLANIEDTQRLSIYSLGVDFIKNHLLFGGQNSFARLLYTEGFSANSSHNFFLNAFIYSGIFGALFIILIFFRMIKLSWLIIWKQQKKGITSVFLAAALLVFLTNSLTHNASLVTGDETIWILFALLIKAVEFERQNRLYENPLRNR